MKKILLEKLVILIFCVLILEFFILLKKSNQFENFNNLKIDAVLNTSSVEEFSLGTNVIFANGILHVNPAAQNYNISIYNLSGQRIFSENNAKTCDLTAKENGIYFVSYTSGDFRKTIKIVKSL